MGSLLECKQKEHNFESGVEMTEQKIFDILRHKSYKDSLKKCEKCNIKHTSYKWCELCQIITNFPNCNNSNEQIYDFVQEMQLSDDTNHDDIIGFSTVFEWISYNQFEDIKEVQNINDLFIKCLATWKDGPLYYDFSNMMGTRESDKKVILRHLYNSQNIDEFLNEVL